MLKRSSATANPLPRRVFYWILAFSCVSIIGVTIFLSLGYRYSVIEGNIFIHAGSLLVKSTPQSAEIKIDGEVPAGRTNFLNDSYHITGLKPGTYSIDITAQGHKNWQKDIVITSGLATEFWNIDLIKESYERESYNALDPQGVFFAPKYDLMTYPHVAASEDGQETLIPFINVDQNIVERTITIPDVLYASKKNENVEWSPDTAFVVLPVERLKDLPIANALSVEEGDGPDAILTQREQVIGKESDAARSAVASDDSVLASPENDYLIVHRGRNENESTFLSLLVAQFDDVREIAFLAEESVAAPGSITEGRDVSIEEVPAFAAFSAENMSTPRWHPDVADTLFLRVGAHLITLNVRDENAENAAIIYEDVLAYDFADDGLYMLSTNGDLLYDKNYEGTDVRIIAHFAIDTESSSHRIITYDIDRTIYIDDDTGKLFVYNNNNATNNRLTRSLAEEGVVDARFSDDGKKLFYYSETEVFAFFTREWNTQPLRKENILYNVYTSETGITTVEWAPSYEQLIIAESENLSFVELDYRGTYTVTQFLERAIDDKNIIMDHGRGFLFFTDVIKDSNRTQLFSIPFPSEPTGIFQ